MRESDQNTHLQHGRLRDWHEAGVWEKLHQTLLEHLQEAEQLDWDRACMESASIKAKKGDQPSAQTRQTVGDPGLNGTY